MKKMIKKKTQYDYLIVGAGISGIVLAERLASIGKKILLIDKREHIGGNCYDYIDGKIIVQNYCPHIFHTSTKEVYDYLSKFTDFNDYKHKVLTYYDGVYYPMPINRDTINKFYNINLTSEQEVIDFLKKKKVKIKNINNSEDVVVSKFGKELFNAFIKNYTKKQWDKFPKELDKSVLERLPIRYDSNPYYFQDKYQGVPVQGYTKMFDKMLKSKNITLMLNTDFFARNDVEYLEYKKIIYTGKIDEFFNHRYGRLEYRGIQCIFEKLNSPEFQPNSVVNYPEPEIQTTRITEFKKFYNERCNYTIICREIFNWDYDTPAYPVQNKKNLKLCEKYKKEIARFKDIYFVGRLAEYKYYNMDAAVKRALDMFKEIK
jgi:UDP-galactopyranose mutase